MAGVSAQPKAVTTSVSGTDAQIGAAITTVFTDPNVVGAIGNAGGAIVGAIGNVVGIPIGKTPEQIKAEQEAADKRKAAETQQMLIIGGAIAVVVIVIGVVVVARSK